MESVCVMFGIKPDRVRGDQGKMVEDYWGPSMKLLGEINFLNKLKEYNKDIIPPTVMKKIRER